MAAEIPTNYDHSAQMNTDGLSPYINSSDFETVSKSPAFVDKTLFIETFFLCPHHYVLSIVPPGFGKSTNLDMLKRFASMNIDKTTGKIGSPKESVNYKLFKEARLISREKDFINKYFGQYAVIHLSLKDVYGDGIESLIETYSQALSKTFSEHRYLLNSDKITNEEKEHFSKYISSKPMQELSELHTGIGYLARILSKHCENYEIITLVDDYDAPLLKFLTDENISNEYEDQFLKFFKNIYEAIMVLEKDIVFTALITGVTSLGWTLFPQEATIWQDRFLHYGYFSNYYGINITELSELARKLKSDVNYIRPVVTYYGHSCLTYKCLFNTRTLMYYFNNRQEFNDYYDFPQIAKSINLQTVLTRVDIRYCIEKTLQMFRFDISVYLCKHPLIVKHLREICLGKGSPWEYGYLYSQLLTDFGFFLKDITAWNGQKKSFIKADNIYVRELFKNEIEHFYTKELNSWLLLGAEHFNRLSISPDRHYFSKLAEILKQIYTMSATNIPDITNKNVYTPFIAILGKSEFHINKLFKHMEGLFIYKKLTGVVCVIKYQSAAKFKLEGPTKTLQQALMHPAYRHPFTSFFHTKIVLAITFDETFSFVFQITTK